MEEKQVVVELKTLQQEYGIIKNNINKYNTEIIGGKKNNVKNIIDLMNKLCGDLINVTTNAITYGQEVENKNYIIKYKLLKLLKETDTLYKIIDEKNNEIRNLEEKLESKEERIEHLEKLNEIKNFYENNL
uniref:Borrelia family protein n=1 Tax=Strongyloides venezuelensis TaxID=75913 RepID=A0A0K0FV19_STRVS